MGGPEIYTVYLISNTAGSSSRCWCRRSCKQLQNVND